MNATGYGVNFVPKGKVTKANENRAATWVAGIWDQIQQSPVPESVNVAGCMAPHLTWLVTKPIFRVICAPSPDIKEKQSQVLKRLSKIPAHRNAHGFIKGRDPKTCAGAHCAYWGQQPKGLVVLNCDVQNFFHSISEGAVRTALEKHGLGAMEVDRLVEQCMLPVSRDLAADLLEALLLSRAGGVVRGRYADERIFRGEVSSRLGPMRGSPQGNWAEAAALVSSKLLGLGPAIGPGARFLPQGSPASPVISNLVCKIIDIRLEAMAKAFGAFYTRYADDLTFSWPAFTKGKVIDGMRRCSEEVIKEYGMIYNPDKVRVMGPGTAQDIVGYVINSGKPTIRQSIRRSIHKEIKLEQASRKATDFTVKGRLLGLAGYVQSAHPEEARKMKEKIVLLKYKTNRRVRVLSHDDMNGDEIETVQSSVAGAGRKVSIAIAH